MPTYHVREAIGTSLCDLRVAEASSRAKAEPMVKGPQVSMNKVG